MIRLDREIEAKYEILAKMGEGGFGSVYKVRHKVFQEIRVIKTAKMPQSETAERARFISEAKRGYHFRHEGIARVLDFEVTSEGTAYIAMEFIDGMNLRELLAISRQPQEPERVIDIALQTLAALAYLHERGVVHRDISPDNLMLARADQRIKLIDLGIAKSIEGSLSLTLDGRFIGKVTYASPEQFGGGADPRSDLYSLGIVMYELLTAQRPVTSTDPRAVMAAHVMGELRSFHDADPEGRVPANLRAVVARALRREPAERFQSAAEFAAALQSLKERAPLPETEVVEITAEDLEAMTARHAAQMARVTEAQRRELEENDWCDAAAADTVDAWRLFLEKHADSPQAMAARMRLAAAEQAAAEETAWAEAAKSGTSAGWSVYLQRFTKSHRRAEAERRRAEAEQEEARQRR